MVANTRDSEGNKESLGSFSIESIESMIKMEVLMCVKIWKQQQRGQKNRGDK